MLTNPKLQKEMEKYELQMKSFLPIEKQVNQLRHRGLARDEIIEQLGNKANLFEYVPKVLYHGSTKSLDIIKANESTQKGTYVYATDNPVHALFFAIFRNSSIARAHISEHIDSEGNYKVSYQIDERQKGALEEIITDRNVTIHVCDGQQFLKPQGEAYIGREWISKEGQNIVPIDKIEVNIKEFFQNLEKQGLVEYSKYEKSKDWKTVIDLLGNNYPFGLGTERANNQETFDQRYTDYISTNFPEQFEFSKHFRDFVKKVMSADYNSKNPNRSTEEMNAKLKYIRNTANSFLIAHREENGKLKWEVDLNKINDFLQQYNHSAEEKEHHDFKL